MPNNTDLKIRDSDLRGDCFRLNQRFSLAEGRIAAVEAKVFPASTSTGVSPLAAVGKITIGGTHQNRVDNLLPESYPGTIYVENDRGNVAYQSQYFGSTLRWAYVSGIYPRTQAQLAALAADMNSKPNSVDDGFRVFVSDFCHVLWWDPSLPGWTWAPEDDRRAGEGPIFRETDPSPTTGWHLYDGGSTTYLKFDGSTGTVTLPDLTASDRLGQTYIAGSGSNSGVTAAVAPTIAVEPTVSSNSAGTPTGAVQFADLGYGSVQGGSGSTVVTSGGHTHGLTMDPLAPHTHTLSGGTLNTDGTPKTLGRRCWFRR
jgi:hypothetical protein